MELQILRSAGNDKYFSLTNGRHGQRGLMLGRYSYTQRKMVH
uniref:Uncharacterized protein n=1 Tax=Arundo donax TaxID=35708 RepID=A0A0A9C0Q3_ARUDO